MRLALLVGVVGGLFWISLAFFPPACTPVTEASEVDCNRLWTPPFVGMLIGAIGLFRLLRPVVSGATKSSLIALVIGFAMMAGGNGGEYWIAFELPHQGGAGALIRSLLWMTLLAGWLTALIASAVLGVRLSDSLSGSGRSKWPSLLFILPLPLTFAFATLGPSRMGIPVGLLGILIGVYGLAYPIERKWARDETASPDRV
jgi:hypothetical protein